MGLYLDEHNRPAITGTNDQVYFASLILRAWPDISSDEEPTSLSEKRFGHVFTPFPPRGILCSAFSSRLAFYFF